jgi:hypothetical protein
MIIRNFRPDAVLYWTFESKEASEDRHNERGADHDEEKSRAECPAVTPAKGAALEHGIP